MSETTAFAPAFDPALTPDELDAHFRRIGWDGDRRAGIVVPDGTCLLP
jgi:hypothetical protein